VRFCLGRHAPSNGSSWYPWGAESPAAFYRFDMSFCLVHNVALLRGRHSTNLIESVAQSADLSEFNVVKQCLIVLLRARVLSNARVQKEGPVIPSVKATTTKSIRKYRIDCEE
jgi:hypothetical protein